VERPTDTGAVTVRAAAPAATDVTRLVTAMEQEMAQRWGNDDSGPSLVHDARFLVAELDGRAVGCVAVQPLPGGIGELKRMYVAPEVRGRGVGRRLLHAAEHLAGELGFAALRLETGTRQPEAVALYERSGWTRITPYGYWRDSPESICFEKHLSS
jgi:GNAT superfamily N-acetyltransferase